jgi:hypothetical protein
LPELKRIIAEAATVPGRRPFQIDITGGEPFLEFELLVEVIEYGVSLGAFMSCMTNGYWATSPEKAVAKLQILKDKGLHSLGVSTSRPHQQFVPMRRVRVALDAARSIGLPTELKVAVQKGDFDDGGFIDECKRELHATVTSVFTITPHKHEGPAPLPEERYIRNPGLPEDKCPGQVMMMEPGGAAFACCASGSSNGFLRLGTVGVDRLADLDSHHRRNAKFRLLRKEGPIHFAREAIRRGEGGRLRSSYAGTCDLCLQIANDPVLSAIAEDVCREQELADLRKAWGLEEEDVAPLSVL